MSLVYSSSDTFDYAPQHGACTLLYKWAFCSNQLHVLFSGIVHTQQVINDSVQGLQEVQNEKSRNADEMPNFVMSLLVLN